MGEYAETNGDDPFHNKKIQTLEESILKKKNKILFYERRIEYLKHDRSKKRKAYGEEFTCPLCSNYENNGEIERDEKKKENRCPHCNINFTDEMSDRTKKEMKKIEKEERKIKVITNGKAFSDEMKKIKYGIE